MKVFYFLNSWNKIVPGLYIQHFIKDTIKGTDLWGALDFSIQERREKERGDGGGGEGIGGEGQERRAQVKAGWWAVGLENAVQSSDP